MQSVIQLCVKNDTTFGQYSHLTFRLGLIGHLLPLKLIKMNSKDCLMRFVIRSSYWMRLQNEYQQHWHTEKNTFFFHSRIFSSGNVGPYKNSSNRAVNAKFTRFHCSISAIRCLNSLTDSCNVFHSDGDGKLRTQAMSQTSNKTLKTRSHSWSLTSSFTPGGASNTSFIANRNSNNDSHVSGVSFCDDCDTCCNVRSTRWHNTAWRFIKSAPKFV